ncbi:MAG: RNA polymerase sigma factor [Gammaproteobacteria bacterium]|nr:RNA polymerase sigma factor [Gammaproteobacteria bacterium]
MAREDTIYSAFLSWRDYLARIVSRIVPPHDIEDIVQETYVRACQFQSKHAIKSPSAFMTKIARNLALDYVKRAEWRLTSSIDGDAESQLVQIQQPADEPFDKVASGEEFAHFCEAVRQLPIHCRRVFVLKKVYGHSQRDIARELNLSENTVEKHVAQGIKHCTHYMRKRLGTDRRGSPLRRRPVLREGGR